MAVVKSTIYPDLLVHDLGVQFRDGVADVSDPKVLAILEGVEGVEVPKARAARK